MPGRELESVLGDMRSFIGRHVVAGFEAPSSIVDAAVGFVAGETTENAANLKK
jgi:hypothetical protein